MRKYLNSEAESIGDILKSVMLKIQKQAIYSGHLEENERVCFKCGSIVLGEDLGDHPEWLDFYCDGDKCNNSWGEQCEISYPEPPEGWHQQQDAIEKKQNGGAV